MSGFPLVFDGHNDTLLALYQGERGDGGFFAQSDKGHIDLPRARAGGFGGGFFAIWVPNDPKESGTGPITEVAERPALDLANAQHTAIAMAAILFRTEAASEGQLKVVRTADEIARCLENDVIAAIFHLEGAEPLDTNLDALEVFYQAGLRSLGIVWSRPNAFAHGVPFGLGSPDTGPGLTDAGRALVQACNRLGVMLDLSHLNEQGFWDVARLSTAPLVASHSNVHALCPTTRNLTDRQLAAIKESDGLVGLNFHVGFLREDGQTNRDTPFETMVRHVDYLVEKLGIDRVGLGSDFDGCTISNELGDVRGLPKLLGALAARGYDDASLRKIAHENWLRVLKKTWGK